MDTISYPRDRRGGSGRHGSDGDVPRETRERLRETLQASGDVVSDLHVWRVGPCHLAAVASVVSDFPRAPEHYKPFSPVVLPPQ